MRMGQDKALVTVDGQFLLARVVDATAHLGPTWIVGGEPSLLGQLAGSHPQAISHVQDDAPGAGPFAALVSALEHVQCREALVVSCDLAWPRARDVDLLVNARRSSGAEIAVPMVQGERQWHALAIDTRVTPKLIRAKDAGIRSLRRGFHGCSEVVVCSPAPDFFGDVDTPEELDAVRDLVERSN